MQWVALRKYHVHLIDREVGKVMEKHREMRESIIEGDILSVQKLSELQLSIKRRIHQIDEFYNANCLDERVRFLQGPRMKLWRLLNNSMIVEKDKELTVNLPWKNTNSAESQKGLNTSSMLNATKKNQFRDSTLKNNSRLQFNKSSHLDSSEKASQLSLRKKPNITLQIPDESPYEKEFQNSHKKQEKSKQFERNRPKTGRKTQYIPKKAHNNSSFSMNVGNQPDQRTNKMKTSQSNWNQQQPTSRSKVTNNSKSRALTENGNTGSMKKLNDLIFTIKMTKQEYQGFMDMKKRLDRQER